MRHTTHNTQLTLVPMALDESNAQAAAQDTLRRWGLSTGSDAECEAEAERSLSTVSDGDCEDSDAQCPYCAGRCTRASAVTLLRSDMADVTGTAFCGLCAEDALSSGVFTVVGE